MADFSKYASQVSDGTLSPAGIKILRSVEAITAEEAEALSNMRRMANKETRKVSRSADFRDLVGFVNRAGLGGVLVVTADANGGAVLSSPGGHSAVFSAGQIKKVTAALRCFADALMAKDSAESSAEGSAEDSAEAPRSLRAVG